MTSKLIGFLSGCSERRIPDLSIGLQRQKVVVVVIVVTSSFDVEILLHFRRPSKGRHEISGPDHRGEGATEFIR